MKKVCTLESALAILVLLFGSSCVLAAQQRPTDSVVVPRRMNFSGRAVDALGKTISGIASITFSIYNGQYSGSPLWMETQNVQTDARGNYSVQLGAMTSEGLPLDLFSSGEARWLGVRVNGGEEQPRVLLLSVPYALKAADAQTLGGLPASAFALAAPTASNSLASPTSPSSPLSLPNVGGSGTQGYLPLWTDSNGDLGNSILYQTGTGSSAKIGINEKNPILSLDVNGGELVRGLFEMATQGYATKNKGYNSQPVNLESSAFNNSTQKYTLNHFQWQAEPAGNNTSTPGATLNLLYGTDPNQPAETGLSLNNQGLFTFASGQAFPGTGTITGVSAGNDLTGGGKSGNVTLNVDTTKVPQLNAANTFTGNQTINGNVSATGVVTGGSYQIGNNIFAYGSYANQNAFLGFSGNATTSGGGNTAGGYEALFSNTTGDSNTATGNSSLAYNTTGTYNTASGTFALYKNTSGPSNTASGYQALASNTTGGSNTAIGTEALAINSTGNFNIAIGSSALYENTTGSSNTASGAGALEGNTTGYSNTADGSTVLHSNSTGAQNTAGGLAALYSNTIADNNTAYGFNALYYTTTGGGNTASGYEALFSNITGYLNTAVGYDALYSNQTGTYLSCIGYNCNAGADGLSNATAIGAFATVGLSNALVLGGTGEHGVKVGIGTSTPSNILTIARGAGHPVSDSWETYSSRRWKTNIKTLPDALSKVERLRGVSYDLKDSGKHEIGVIAEEVGAVVPEVVSYEANGKDASGVDYSRLTALLIEAVKQQQQQIALQQRVTNHQQRQIAIQREQIRILRNRDVLLQGQLAQLKNRVQAITRTGLAEPTPDNRRAMIAKAQY